MGREVRGVGTPRAGLPSQRQLRVAEQMRHCLADALRGGQFRDPRLETVSLTVAEVRASPDLRHAVVYVAELGRPLGLETAAALTAEAPHLAGRLAREMRLRYAPRLRFVADSTFEEAAKLGRLITQDAAGLERLAGRGAETDG